MHFLILNGNGDWDIYAIGYYEWHHFDLDGMEDKMTEEFVWKEEN